MTLAGFKKSREILVFWGAPLDRQKVDDLNKQPGVPAALAFDGFNQIPKTGNEPVVPDSQQRPARDVAHTGSFYYNRSRAACRKAPVPLDDVWGDEAVVGGAPGNHCRDPRATLQCSRTYGNRTEQQRSRGFVFSRPDCWKNGMSDWFLRVPHMKRGQKSEVRSQRSEVRHQRSEVRSQRSEVRSQRSDIRGQNSEISGQKSVHASSKQKLCRSSRAIESETMAFDF